MISLGSLSLSSFGFFLTLGFLVGLFIVWRLSRVYDIDEEKTLDATLMSFFGGLIGARALFTVFNLNTLNSLAKVVEINRFPGLMLLGGLIAAPLVLWLLCQRLKLSFFQMADLLIVGFLAALVFGSVGCLLSSCHPGVVWHGPLGVEQAGLLERRLPIQLLETLAFGTSFLYLYAKALRWHFPGKILGLGLILFGLISFTLDYGRSDSLLLFNLVSLTKFYSLVSFLLGWVVIYKQGKRDVFLDLGNLTDLLTNSKKRQITLLSFKKNWYTTRVNLRTDALRFYRASFHLGKSLLRGINVRIKGPKIYD